MPLDTSSTHTRETMTDTPETNTRFKLTDKP